MSEERLPFWDVSETKFGVDFIQQSDIVDCKVSPGVMSKLRQSNASNLMQSYGKLLLLMEWSGTSFHY